MAICSASRRSMGPGWQHWMNKSPAPCLFPENLDQQAEHLSGIVRLQAVEEKNRRRKKHRPPARDARLNGQRGVRVGSFIVWMMGGILKSKLCFHSYRRLPGRHTLGCL